MEFHAFVLFRVPWFVLPDFWLLQDGWFYTSGWVPPSGWQGPEVVFYQRFDGSYGLVLMEGNQQVDSVPLVSGKVRIDQNAEAQVKYLFFEN